MDSILNTEQVREMVDTLWVSWHYRRRLVTLADSHEQMRADRDALAELLRASLSYLSEVKDAPLLIDDIRAALAVYDSGKEPGA